MENLYIIKIGGQVIDQEADLAFFLNRFSSIKSNKILIHGGGKLATKIGTQLGLQPRYRDGRRITDDATIELVTMVYGGLINRKIATQLQALGCNAIGLTGADANMIPAMKRPCKEIDFGWVGDVDPAAISVQIIGKFLESGLTPVFAPLTHDGHGHILNTNADTIAATLASALSLKYRVHLMYCFEKAGILEYADSADTVIPFINKERYRRLLKEQKLFAGILPKIENAFSALDAGATRVWIGSASDLLENVACHVSGTLIQ